MPGAARGVFTNPTSVWGAAEILSVDGPGSLTHHGFTPFTKSLVLPADAHHFRPLLDLPLLNVKNHPYHAQGDGVYGNDGVAVATDATFTSATAAWVVGDVGKIMCIPGAGVGGATLTTPIASINSPTSIELTVAASTSINPAEYVYGTDDTVALQAAIDSLRIGTGTTNYPDSLTGGVVLLPLGRYVTTAALEVWEGVTLVGTGVWASEIFNANVAGDNCIEFLASSRQAAGQPEFFGGAAELGIRGNRSSGHGIFVDVMMCERNFDRLLIRGHGRCGVYLDTVIGSHWSHVYVTENYGWGLDIEGGVTVPGSVSTVHSFEACRFRINGRQHGGAADGVAVAGDATFTSATAAFGVNHVNMCIRVVGAGLGGLDHFTTIASINSPTSIEMADVAVVSVNPATFTWAAGGVLLAGSVASTFDQKCVAESNLYGPGMVVLSTHNVVDGLYLENNDPVAYGGVDEQLRIVGYANQFYQTYQNNGFIHLAGTANNNQLVGTTWGTSNPNLIIGASCASNQILLSKPLPALHVIDASPSTFWDDKDGIRYLSGDLRFASGNIQLAGGAIYNGMTTSSLSSAGGSAVNAGGRIIEYGEAHATKPGVIEFLTGVTVRGKVDTTGMDFVTGLDYRVNAVPVADNAAWTGYTPTVTAKGAMTIANLVVNRAAYKALGTTVTVCVNLTLDVGGTLDNEIYVTTPAGCTPGDSLSYNPAIIDMGVAGATLWGITVATGKITLKRMNGTNYSAYTGVNLSFTMTYERA